MVFLYFHSYFLWWESNYLGGTSGQDRTQRTLNDMNIVDRNNSRSGAAFYYWPGCLWNEKELFFCFSSFPVMQTPGHSRADNELKYIHTQKTHKQAKQQETSATGKIKDNTGNLYSVISWASKLTDTFDHTGRVSRTLDKISLRCYPGLFQLWIKTPLIWDLLNREG